MTNSKEYYRRLPHIQPDNAVFFVTFRLKGTLPAHLIDELKNDLEANNNSLVAKHDYYQTIEDFLDHENYGPTWLKQKDLLMIYFNRTPANIQKNPEGARRSISAKFGTPTCPIGLSVKTIQG